MRILQKVTVLAGGWLLVLGGIAWSQDPPCAIPPCMTPIFGQPAQPSSSRVGNSGIDQRSTSGAASQRSGTPPGTTSQPSMPPSLSPIIPQPDSNTPLNPSLEQEQSRMRNTDRQKQLVSDTQKLLALANELKSDVDKSNKDMLSIDVIKKAEEIEKLAHSVKEKMKGS
jgi:hypothetical protein